ncbi:MAG: [protein-PII] uridylyltransferase [Desulfatiglandales bacterium]
MNSIIEELRKSREELRTSFRTGRLQEGLEERYTEAVDCYFRRCIEESCSGGLLFRRGVMFSLIAVGGYGRRDLSLGSDIDLLVLFASKIPEEAKLLVKEILFPLWDLGMDLGYAVRSLRDCVRLANADFEVLTSLLDARFIGGGSPLFLTLVEHIDKKVLSKKQGSFARWLRDTDVVRKEAFGDASHMLEPDLKKGIGSLRDIHHMMWMSRVEFGLRTPRDLETTGRLSHSEHEDLEKAGSLIRCVRSHMHDLSGRKNDLLTFEFQPEIARRLGYRRQGHSLAVERFMGDLHAAMTSVKTLCRRTTGLFARQGQGEIRDADQAALRPGLALNGDGIRFESATAVPDNPLLLIQAFEASSRYGIHLSLETMRLIREFLPFVDDTFRASGDAALSFLKILRADGAADTLDQMFESRFLDAYIPEFEAVRDRVQFDTYHLFPVGRHSLETVRALKNVGRQKEILLSSMFMDLTDPDVLLLSAVFHDIGKSKPDHSRHGAVITSRILERLGLDSARVKEASFLVGKHLLLVETATRRDLGDEKAIVGCARIIGTIERLKMLYLLTWADACATGPRAWTDWTAALMQELFFKVLHILERGELASPDAIKRAEEVQREAIGAAAGRIERDPLHRVLQAMPPRYLLNTKPSEIVRHMELFQQLEILQTGGRKTGFVMSWRLDEAWGCWEVSFLAPDRPGLFSDAAGVFALNNINILSSEIYTWRDHTAVDVFRVILPAKGRPPQEIRAKVEGDFAGVFEGRIRLGESLERKAAFSILTKRGTPVRPSEVRVDNDASDFFTLVEVFANDRVGLLYDVTRTLTELGLDIRIARISTKGDQAADAFYVRNLDGRKVEDPGEMVRIQEVLESGTLLKY